MTHSGSIYKLSEKSNGQKPTRILRKISFFGKSLNGTFPIEDMPWPVRKQPNGDILMFKILKINVLLMFCYMIYAVNMILIRTVTNCRLFIFRSPGNEKNPLIPYLTHSVL